MGSALFHTLCHLDSYFTRQRSEGQRSEGPTAVHLFGQVIVIPRLSYFVYIGDAIDLEWQLFPAQVGQHRVKMKNRITVLSLKNRPRVACCYLGIPVSLGHGSFSLIRVIEALKRLPKRAWDVVAIVRVPAVDNVHKGLGRDLKKKQS